MMKRYKITLPTKKQCEDLIIKFEGQGVRTTLWLTGLAVGVVAAATNSKLNVCFTNSTNIYFETNSYTVMTTIKEHLEVCGCKVEETAAVPA